MKRTEKSILIPNGTQIYCSLWLQKHYVSVPSYWMPVKINFATSSIIKIHLRQNKEIKYVKNTS